MVSSLLKDGRGYSLMEVLVSIIILALAIIPMVGMFDMGLNGVRASSHYDKARTLANLKLEEAKNLSFTNVEGNFPDVGVTTPYDGSDWFTEPGTDFATFQYTVYKDYMGEWEFDDDSPTREFGTSGAPTDLIRLRVEVRWGEDNGGDGIPDKSFTTYGLVAR